MPRPHKPKDVVDILEKAGFILTRQKGSHARFNHADGRMVTVPLHSKQLPTGTLLSIIKQSDLPRDLF